MARLICTKCWALLPEYAAAHGSSTCVSCGSLWEVQIFPALLAVAAPLQKEQLELTEGAASCFHHASKRADSSCSRCGKFLCALCTLEMGSEVWCATCLSAGTTAKGVHALEARRILWDSIALAVAIIPAVTLLGIYFWIITAPAAIFLALKYWRRPTSLLPRTKARFVFAIGIALVELGLWLLLAWTAARALSQVKG